MNSQSYANVSDIFDETDFSEIEDSQIVDQNVNCDNKSNVENQDQEMIHSPDEEYIFNLNINFDSQCFESSQLLVTTVKTEESNCQCENRNIFRMKNENRFFNILSDEEIKIENLNSKFNSKFEVNSNFDVNSLLNFNQFFIPKNLTISNEEFIKSASSFELLKQAYKRYGSNYMNKRQIYSSEFMKDIGIGELIIFKTDNIVKSIEFLHSQGYDFRYTIFYIITYIEFYCLSDADFSRILNLMINTVKFLFSKGSVFTPLLWKLFTIKKLEINFMNRRIYHNIYFQLPEYFLELK